MYRSKYCAFSMVGLILLVVGAPLLVGCKTTAADRQVLYVSCRNGKHVLVYEIDGKSGSLKERQRMEVPGTPGPLALAPDGGALYTALGTPTQLLPMPRDRSTGELSLLEPTPIDTYPTYLDIDATGRYAIAAAYGKGIVSTYRINEQRRVEPRTAHAIKTAENAHACLIDPSNRFVYVPHTGPNAIFQFRFDATAGKLTPIQPILVKGGGSTQSPAGPRHYTYHPRLGVVYVVNELNSSVSAYQWDRKTGQLARFQTLSTLPAGYTQRNTCADIHVTPDGRFLYASNRGHDTIAAYKLDADGQMRFIDWFKTEAVPREFEIDLNGRYLYSAGLRSNKLAAYAIDSRTGRLTRIGTYDTPESPIWVLAAPLK